VSDYEMKLMDLDTEHLGIPVCSSFCNPILVLLFAKGNCAVPSIKCMHNFHGNLAKKCICLH